MPPARDKNDPAAAIHADLERVLDGFRRAGTSESTIAAAIERARRGSAAITAASLIMGGQMRR